MSRADALALVPLAAAVVALLAYCLVDIARHDVRLLPKWAWALICFASVPLGAVVYLAVGRVRAEPPPASGAWPDLPAARATEALLEGHLRKVPATATHRVPAPPVVRTSGLTKIYGTTTVLDHVDLVVPRGSVFGLVGPNGAGKTTLLHLLAGLRRPDEGSVEVMVSTDRVAVLPDTPSFESWMTAREVVDLARTLTRPELPASRSDDALALVDLAADADRRVGGFSRGMLQRLGLATTIVGEPELLLLDEPCSALDPLGRREVLDLVSRLAGRRTVVFSSHILADVQEVCDAVAVLREGHVLYQGALADLLVGRASPAFALRVRPPVAPLTAALRALPWVTEVEERGADALRVTVRSLIEAEHELPVALASADASVVSLVPAAGDLEHVFLEVTA
jgi:ABC-2 type transport system ATP-binding protein